MRAFLDTVGIHRVHAIIAGSDSRASIRITDAVALLNGAEHIMFSDKVLVPSFETSEIWEVSQQTLSFLRSLGVIDLDSGRLLIEVSDFTEEAYGSACVSGAPRALEFLSLELRYLETCARLADKTAIPMRFDYSSPEKWLSRNWPRKERDEVRSRALAEKSKGTVDFMVCSSDALYERIRDLAREAGITRCRRIAPIVQLACFVALNEQLAKQKDAVYSPAPQRARIIHRVDSIFRNSLVRTIQQAIREAGHGLSFEPIRAIERGETLPLPMFAIHFLRRERITSPNALLEAARRLRDAPDVARFRSWLTEGEKSFSSPDLKKRQRAQAKLDSMRQDLKTELQGDALYAIFRPRVGADPTQGWSLDPDVPGLLEAARRLWQRWFSREAILLSDLSREFSLDSEIGTDIIGMLGRAVIGQPRQ